MLEPLYTAAEMRAAEEAYPGYPDTIPELMERAGRSVAETVLRDFAEARRITVVCGGGSNGGDGRVAARHLEQAGRDVRVVDAKAGEAELGEPELIVDALFGTGFAGEPREPAARLIERINAAGVPVVAVDVPSGVDSSTGEVAGAAVEATATVTFHGEKVGLRVTPGGYRAGRVTTVDIGLAPLETRHARVTEAILGLVPRRRAHDTKYTAGSLLVVGGSRGMTGAAALAARAAFRADAGYVTVAAPQESLPVLETLVLEAVKRPLGEVLDAAGRARSLALGPGLGRSDERRALVRRLLEGTDLPAVVDADALFGLEPFARSGPTVLTPHSGELARLLGVEAAWVDAHRLEALARAVERFRCVVLLKGAGTLVGAPGHGALVCDGAPRLATAGTGDVLTGIVGAFLAKGMDARLAAAAAASAHTAAAVAAGPGSGLVASDVVEALPRVLERAL
ncbi:MAG TPA: NAD(P)H-hydrate dehydratase [Gaiellaceae bacterium]|nr:NAD(P)H-hydrate dehydratase [Gaiellaceae bacterium]